MLSAMSSASLGLGSTIPECLAVFGRGDLVHISLSLVYIFFFHSLTVFKLFLPFYSVSREMKFAYVRISEQMGELY